MKVRTIRAADVLLQDLGLFERAIENDPAAPVFKDFNKKIEAVREMTKVILFPDYEISDESTNEKQI